MFNVPITRTPLSSNEANDFFSNIHGAAYKRVDISFVATLRALLAERIPEDEQVELTFSRSAFSAAQMDANDKRTVCDGVYGNMGYFDAPTGNIDVHDFAASAADAERCLGLVRDDFTSAHEGYVRLDKIEEFFRRSFKCVCFVNADKKNVALFVCNLDFKRLHYLQCAIPAFLPWYFADNPPQGTEMELVESLTLNTSDRYIACIQEVAGKYDFRTTKIQRLLAGFETKYEQIKLSEMQTDVCRLIDKIAQYNDAISGLLQQKREKENVILGLETKISQGNEESEVMEYFLTNKHLVLEDVTDTTMTFTCKDYITYFDEDMAEEVISNRRSYVYVPNGRACNNIIRAEDMEMLMRAIFIDQTLRIRVCAAYKFDLTGRVSAIRDYAYGWECDDCTPNPHTDQYACMGNYEREINNLLTRHDYIGALEQAIASCKSLNFGDSYVMREFMMRLYGISNSSANIRCIELPSGRVVTPKEAVAWLKEQAQGGENDNG